jgi:hypothetical protein
VHDRAHPLPPKPRDLYTLIAEDLRHAGCGVLSWRPVDAARPPPHRPALDTPSPYRVGAGHRFGLARELRVQPGPALAGGPAVKRAGVRAVSGGRASTCKFEQDNGLITRNAEAPAPAEAGDSTATQPNCSPTITSLPPLAETSRATMGSARRASAIGHVH